MDQFINPSAEGKKRTKLGNKVLHRETVRSSSEIVILKTNRIVHSGSIHGEHLILFELALRRSDYPKVNKHLLRKWAFKCDLGRKIRGPNPQSQQMLPKF